MYKIYKITNNINGNYYIGYTKLELDKRWNLHCNSGSLKMLIYRAIQKYGKESFTIELIDQFATKEEAVNKEVYLIEKFKPVYNIHHGGTGGPMYGPMNGMYGKKHSDEWKAHKSVQMKGAKNHMYGKKHTLEAKQKMSKARTGKPAYNKGKPMNDHVRENLRKPKTEEHKEKLRNIYLVDGAFVYNAKLYCEKMGYNYICFTQAAKHNKNYRGHIIALYKKGWVKFKL
jgi:group I intron endonuclease